MPKIGDIMVNKFYVKHIWAACIDCGKERWVDIKKGKPVSKRCIICANKSLEKRMTYWKGGEMKNKAGYVLIRIFPNDPFYPMAQQNGYVLEHRLIMAQKLNRCLYPWEIVHHKNGITDDNYENNLELVTEIKHKQFTRYEIYFRKLIKKIAQLEAENKKLKKLLEDKNENQD